MRNLAARLDALEAKAGTAGRCVQVIVEESESEEAALLRHGYDPASFGDVI